MKSINILLVEDNEGDILLTREALESSKYVKEISVARNGKIAIDFLYKKGDYKNVSSPNLILLDINLPLKNGIEVLQILKSDNATKHIPIIMLTTSSSEYDVLKSYKYHANAFITKPVDVNEFLDAIATIENFWFNTVKLVKAKYND